MQESPPNLKIYTKTRVQTIDMLFMPLGLKTLAKQNRKNYQITKLPRIALPKHAIFIALNLWIRFGIF